MYFYFIPLFLRSNFYIYKTFIQLCFIYKQVFLYLTRDSRNLKQYIPKKSVLNAENTFQIFRGEIRTV